MIDRAKYLERQRRYNQSEKGKARHRRWYEERYYRDPFFALERQQYMREWRANNPDRAYLAQIRQDAKRRLGRRLSFSL